MGESSNSDPRWGLVLEEVRRQINRQQFETWFRKIRLLSLNEDLARIGVPSPFFKDWLTSYYLDVLRQAIRVSTDLNPVLDFVIVEDDMSAEPTPPARGEDRVPVGEPMERASGDESGYGMTPFEAGEGASGPRSSGPPAGGTHHGTARQTPGQHGPRGRDSGQPGSGLPGSGQRGPGPAWSAGQPDGEHTDLRFSPIYPNFLSDVLLNQHYTFDNFVIGPRNKLPHAAAIAVSDRPATAYNPLFLHGSVGLGKTHLLQAVCHSMLQRRKDLKILFLSCETFTNQFISAVKSGSSKSFRFRYRHVDVLLIDDIHFLAKKEQTQEEFFHTFNTLYNQGKQIILSSDSPPKEIPTLQERLVSRFKWGLVAEIEPPDFETRMLIVKRKARLRGLSFPDDVSEYIADTFTANIRELEGAVLKVVGVAELEQVSLDLNVARRALKSLIQPGRTKITVDQIIAAVTGYYGVKQTDLQSKKRNKSIAFPRQVSMFLSRLLTTHSLEEIGGYFGGRDHTTVLYAADKIEKMRAGDRRFKEELDTLIHEIRKG